jgi:uncharacterized membrane protein
VGNSQRATTETYWQKQIVGLAIALVAMLAIAFSDYRRLVELAPILYVFGLLLLDRSAGSRHRRESKRPALLDSVRTLWEDFNRLSL